MWANKCPVWKTQQVSMGGKPTFTWSGVAVFLKTSSRVSSERNSG